MRAVAAAGGWARVVLTPAFPERGRSFLDSVVRVDGRPIASFDGAGLAHTHIGLASLRTDPGALSHEGVVVVDAETADDLQRIAGAASNVPTLWVGTAGLARALAIAQAGGQLPVRPPSRACRTIVTVVGSRTELARRQVQEALRLNASLRHVEVAAQSLSDPGHAPSVALPVDEDVVISIVGEPGEPAEGEGDETFVRNLARTVSENDREIEGLVIVGGQTARATLLALDVRELDVVGELEPGIALCTDARVRPIVTKSGSFGDDATLHRIHQSLRT